MYVIVRPGPYVNAETNAGGFPLWLTTGAYGQLRTSDPLYTNAWKSYWSNISEIFRPHLITNGGNVVLYQVSHSTTGLVVAEPQVLKIPADRERAQRAMERYRDENARPSYR